MLLNSAFCELRAIFIERCDLKVKNPYLTNQIRQRQSKQPIKMQSKFTQLALNAGNRERRGGTNFSFLSDGQIIRREIFNPITDNKNVKAATPAPKN